MQLAATAIADIQWWIKGVSYASRKILVETPAIILQTVASALGWGATDTITSCGGRWNMEEVPLLKAHGIKYLELLISLA